MLLHLSALFLLINPYKIQRRKIGMKSQCHINKIRASLGTNLCIIINIMPILDGGTYYDCELASQMLFKKLSRLTFIALFLSLLYYCCCHYCCCYCCYCC